MVWRSPPFPCPGAESAVVEIVVEGAVDSNSVGSTNVNANKNEKVEK